MKRLLSAAFALGLAATAGAEDLPGTQLFASAGPGNVGGGHLSLAGGVSQRLLGPLSAVGEVQYARLDNGIESTSAAAGLKWRMLGGTRVSPFVLASMGVVDYRSSFYGRTTGTASSLGAGLDWRLTDRASAFVEARINLWTGGGIGDGLDGHVPLRAGVTLGF
jgi:hypothetical protein